MTKWMTLRLTPTSQTFMGSTPHPQIILLLAEGLSLQCHPQLLSIQLQRKQGKCLRMWYSKQFGWNSVIKNLLLTFQRLVIGASGGPNIISTVAFVAMQNLFLGKNIKDAIDEPRVHHQLLPMTLRHEKRMNKVSNFNLYQAFFGHSLKNSGWKS